MATKSAEDISFFYEKGGFADPNFQKEMIDNQNAAISKGKWRVPIALAVTSVVIVVAWAAMQLGFIAGDAVGEKVVKSIESQITTVEVVKGPNVFSTAEERQRVRGGDTGPLLNTQLDGNLNTAKTQAHIAQENAIHKIRELSGVVDTYAPQLINGKN